ncbi:hypothetical protein [Aeromicrobium alkaliterrae]|uniref:Uncharacterized protein n=1 Tax=Aeromicrobium alkaliterrae TaxID=302168 RepID=A0ABN2JIF3_9ACTN
MAMLNARHWSRKRFVATGLMLLLPIIVIQVLIGRLDGADFYIAGAVNLLLCIPIFSMTATFVKRADELREERRTRRTK